MYNSHALFIYLGQFPIHKIPRNNTIKTYEKRGPYVIKP